MSAHYIFEINESLEMIEPGFYRKTIVGETLSVAVVKFLECPERQRRHAPHRHGEEISLQLTGGCSMYIDGEAGAKSEHILERGDILIIPPDAMHYAVNRYGPDGTSMRLNVVSTLRAESGTPDRLPRTDDSHLRDGMNDVSIGWVPPVAPCDTPVRKGGDPITAGTQVHPFKTGATMHVQTLLMRNDAAVTATTAQLGEEVCAILDGRFDIDIAGQTHTLSAGQAMLIPPNAPRRFQCNAERGTLYRVVMQIQGGVGH